MFTQDDVKVIEGINQIPIFNIENVRGKCIAIPGGVQALVLADDIAREGGLTNLVEGRSQSKGMRQNYGYTKSGIIPIQGDAAELELSNFWDNSNSRKYEVIRWDRFNQYANDSIVSIKQCNPYILQWLSLPIKSGDYIPLEIALVVLMRLNSKKARDFQVILATKIAPEIINNAIQIYQQQLEQYQQQLNYYKDFVDTSTLYSTTEIASEFAMSAQRLRQILQYDFKIIRPCNKTWQIVNHLAEYNYVKNKAINKSNVNDHPYWTNSGREFVINLLTDYGYKRYRKNSKLIVPLVFDNYNR